VLIVGAGPVGLTLANDLATRDISFRIIDQLPEPTWHSRAHGLQSRTVEQLDGLDLAGPMLAAAQHPQPPLYIMSGKRTLARVDFAKFHHEPYPYQLIIWQQRIERILQDRLARRGHIVERGMRLGALEMDDAGVTARIERGDGDRETIRAGYIIGCDGGHSAVREQLGLRMERNATLGHFLLGEFDIAWRRSREAMYEWWHPDGMVSTMYIDFTNRWYTSIECESGAEPTVERMQALFRERTGDAGATLANPAWMSALTFHQAMPEHYIAGRGILAGDTAHVHTAAGGQGMNTGIQDALNLGWKLALAVSGRAAPELLASYERERLPIARRVLRVTPRYQAIQIPRTAVGRMIAGVIWKALAGVRPVGEAAARIGMLSIHYRDSALSCNTSPHTPRVARAGNYRPDAWCHLDGRAVRLSDILRGTGATLLLYAGIAPKPGTLSALRAIERMVAPLEPYVTVRWIFASELDGVGITDGGQHLQLAFGLREPEIIYLRPDGYIGLRTTRLAPHPVRDYLASIYAVRASRTLREQAPADSHSAAMALP
jgi:2-polyprenyl-6-methoxyphenol hydroxylase-like FAD-dependent oxidoreductase